MDWYILPMTVSGITMDRLADRALAVLAGLHVLFLAAFILSLTLTVEQVHAMPVCTGNNLLVQLKKDDPATHAKLEAEAAKVANGDSIFFKIEKDNIEPSWLLGTMHVSDPRVIDLPDAAKAAFDSAKTMVIETTEVLDQAQAAKVMFGRLDLTMLPAGKTLSDYMSDADLAIVKAGLEARGVSMTALSRMRPWMISTMVAMPPCEVARRSAGAEMLDLKLAKDAQEQGKRLKGLETLASQLEAMASLPIEFHAESLVATLRIGDQLTDVFETMISLYDTGQTGIIWPFLKTIGAMGDVPEKGYAEFEEIMVNVRNKTMADNAAPIIDEGGAFIAVGALHLPGEKGVVEYLRQAGYTVTAVR